MKPNKRKRNLSRSKAHLGVCLGSTLAFASAGLAPAPAWADDATRVDKVEKENQELRNRLDALEALAKKEGILASGTSSKTVSALSDITISGFVTSSYFHDSSEPHDNGHISPGYLWNRVNDNFSLNKVKLTIASRAIENNGEKFDIGFRVSLIAGEDAPIVNTKASTVGFDYLREAYVEMNVPIGTGLDVRVGELISLLNYESGDGGAANNNFSQGYQWFYTGNPPSAGVQLGYKINDWLGITGRVQNGLYQGPVDNNSSKTLVGEIQLKPNDKIWVNLIGFGGREDAFAQSLYGGSLLGGWQATKQLSFGTELDYFEFYNPPSAAVHGNSTVWSTGLWTAYDFCKQVSLALRGEFLSDDKGVELSKGDPLGFSNPTGTGQDLTSFALTLNYKPLPNIKIQPEVRFDHTSNSYGFVSGKQDRVIFGAGISYLF